MGEPKPTASLSGMLLARKGGARPAMRRPSILGNHGDASQNHDDLGWNDMGYDVDPAPEAPIEGEQESRQNLLAGAVPEVTPEVRLQQQRIARQLQASPETSYPKEDISALNRAATLPLGGVWTSPPDEEEPELDEVENTPSSEVEQSLPVSAPVKRAPRGSKAKAAFTLRLDKERHLKLRLACAVGNKSAQMIVTEALDQLLDAMPEIGQLASTVPASANK